MVKTKLMFSLVFSLMLGTFGQQQVCSAGDDLAFDHGASSLAVRYVAEAEDWRYVYHEGKWWYYQPDKSWLIWDGNRWLSQSAYRSTVSRSYSAYNNYNNNYYYGGRGSGYYPGGGFGGMSLGSAGRRPEANAMINGRPAYVGPNGQVQSFGGPSMQFRGQQQQQFFNQLNRFFGGGRRP